MMTSSLKHVLIVKYIISALADFEIFVSSKLVEILQSRNIDVYLISGGFKSIIAPIANQLNIPYENIFANRLTFYYNGKYDCISLTVFLI